MIRLSLFFLVFVSSVRAEEWKLPAALDKQTVSFVCPRPVGAGAFTLDARIVLAEINGTAASVWLGRDLNIGFDGGTKHDLFVEGSAVGGKSKALGFRAAELITADKAFDFRVSRDGAGETVVSIGTNEIFRTKALAGKAFAVTFRPHRNTMDILAARLSGDLLPPPPPLEVSVPTAPILIGSENPLMQVTLRLDKARTVTRFELGGAFGNFAVIDANKERHAPTEPIELGAGEHRFQIAGSLPKDADLLKKVSVSLSAVRFADGETLDVAPQDGAAHLRLAYPIHRQGEADCHTTRIPGIVRTKKGTLLGVYDLRYNSSRDLQEHIDIGLSRSADGGRTWEPPRPIMDMGEYGGKPQKENGVSDPNILVDPDTGRIFVSAVWTYGKPNTHQWQGKGSEPGFEIGVTAQFMVVTSDDDGITWSKPQNWTKKLKREEWWLFAPAPGNGIALADGTLVMPTQGRDPDGLPFSNLMWSRDHGDSWTLGAAARDNTTECAVAELSDGSLLLSMRDNRNRSLKGNGNGRALSITEDLGKTWTKHPGDHSALPEPVCMASLISHRLPDGRHVLLFSNPHDKNARRNITIQVSFDDGLTWPNSLLLDEGTGRGYSSLVMVDAETVGILYESSRADLVFQKIALSELIR